ncbi:MAG TPA: hypothetical protein PK375_06385 [Rhodocyclaceae bacterium]|nr:hypothetical protein [Rhodocyclaceae bacterium]HNH35523.1 hypothetical protein [Rhodocyclaceae bacterium]
MLAELKRGNGSPAPAEVPDQAGADSPDPLVAALEESKASGRGLSFFVQGNCVPGVVVSVDRDYVVARSPVAGLVVIRLDRLDGVAGFVETAAERKTPRPSGPRPAGPFFRPPLDYS